jgi:hypothetical protein
VLERWFALSARGATVAGEVEVHPMIWVAVAAFAIHFALPALRRLR